MNSKQRICHKNTHEVKSKVKIAMVIGKEHHTVPPHR